MSHLRSFLFLTLFLFSSGQTLFCAAAAEAKIQPVSVSKTEVSALDTVYVYASRLGKIILPQTRVPSNTTVIPSAVLSFQKPLTLQDALKQEEGVALFDAVGNGRDTTLTLRGFNESSAVTYLVNGVRVNEVDGHGMTFPLVSMDNIETIQLERGSAATIYGSNALAGVVNITTGRPSKKPWSLFGGFDIGSHQGIRFYQGVSGTIQDKVTPLEGAWEYYFRGGRDQGDGFRGNGDYRVTSFDIKTAYVLPEEFGKFYINIKHVDDLISNPGELTRTQYDASVKQTNKPWDRRDYVNTIVQLGTDKKFLDNKITASIMANWRRNLGNFFATTATFTDFVTGSNPDTDFVTSKSRSRDLIWQLLYEDEWDWIKNRSLIGMEFRDGSEFATETDAPGTVINTAALETDRTADTWNHALFWDQGFDLSKWVSVHAGMRHDLYLLQTDNKLTPTDSFSSRWKNSSLATGITLHPHDSTDLFFNYSQGFRVPDISDINPFGGNSNVALQPEKSDSYEAGARFRFRDLFALRASWFLIDMQDEIVFDSSSITPANPFGQNTNIGASRRHGIETGVNVKPLQELELFGTYTLAHAYVRETDGGGSLADGRSLGQIPVHRMTWGFEARPLTRLGEVFEGLRFRLDGSFTGSQHPQTYESTSQATLNSTGGAGHVIKSFTLWNFLASYKFKGQEVYFKVNNLFDNKYYSRAVSATSFGTAIYPAGTYTFVNPGAPREFLAGLRWEIE